jgi:RNA recognition motif-containing protein
MQKNKIFIGNLSYGTTADTLTEIFLKFGEITDCYKPDGKGFGFITFKTDEQAQNAIDEMDGQDLDGRAISVSLARPKTDKPRRDFNDRGRGGYDRERRNW